MLKVLLVEESTTLRTIIARALITANIQFIELNDYQSALDTLRDETALETIGGVVVGWTHYPQAQARALLDELQQPQHRQRTVIVLANKPGELDWQARNPGTIVKAWSNYDEAVIELSATVAMDVSANDEQLEPAAPSELAPRALIVEDSISVREQYRRLLSQNGFCVETASSGEEAVTLAMNGDFDLAIVDYYMPNDNGSVLCKQLKENPATAHMHSIVVTASEEDAIVQECLNAGALECWLKTQSQVLLVCRLRAIAELINSQKRFARGCSRLEAILGAVGECVYGVDIEGVVTFVNAAARRALGFDDALEIVGQSAHALLHPVNPQGAPVAREYCSLHRTYTSGCERVAFEQVFKRHDDEIITTECTVFPLFMDGAREGATIAFHDISNRKARETALREQALQDPLTGLANQRVLKHELAMEIDREHDSGKCSALVYIDLDYFKQFNDNAGHATGDRVLATLALKLGERLRKSDLLARAGDDQFAVILRKIMVDDAMAIAEGLRRLIEQCSFRTRDATHKITASCGLVLLAGMSAAEALMRADLACQIAKRRGRNRTQRYKQTFEQAAMPDLELGWLSRLRQALRDDTFELHYQPVMAMARLKLDELPAEDGALWALQGERQAHYEVLLRLQDGNGELIQPQEFARAAERFDLMHEIDRWVVNAAVARLAGKERQHRGLSFSVNLSPYSICDSQFAELIESLVAQFGINPHRLVFEIAEAGVIDNIAALHGVMTPLVELGCQFALDGFGTGFSTFTQLERLPVDYVKLNQTLIRGLTTSSANRAIVTAMNDVAHSLGMRTVAPGAENAETLRLLKVCGVDYAQGFYIARPAASINGSVPEPSTMAGDLVPYQ
ncbi:MAG: two-component system response regulator [Gammaproteobacteria bacterium]